MTWKTITIIAILFAVAASTIRYFNAKDIAVETKLLERAQANLAATQDHRVAMVKRQNETEADIEQVTDERDEEEKKSLAAQAKEAQLEDDKSQLEDLIAQKEVRLDKLRKDVAEIGEIKDLVEKSENLQAEMATVQQEILIAKENFKKMIATRLETERIIADFREKVSMQRAGEMVTIHASVAATYENWGFVIINAGANQGVNARTRLDVKRGDDVVGALRITNLEPNLSVCDILTVTEDSSINAGDTVAINVLTKWDPEKRAAEAAKLAAPAAPAAPAAAPAAPAAGDDPFAPEPAPATPDDDDPFGLGN